MSGAGSDVRARDGTQLAVWCASAVVGIVTVTLLVAWLLGRPVGGAVLAHGAVLASMIAAARQSHRITDPEARAVLVAAVAVGAMFFLYSSLGQVAFVAIPWDGDPWIRTLDRWLFLGLEPVTWVADRLADRPWATEPLSFFYAAFIPYLYSSIFLGFIGRSTRVRSKFVLAFVLLYGASFMGYLFVPARGPVVAMTDVLTEPLNGGFFHALVVRAVDALGGPHGAFPSLHVGASLLAMLVDFRHGDSLRGLIYVPLVALICVATVALRYHYVVDIAAGAALAYAALVAAEHWTERGVMPLAEPVTP